MPDRRQATRTRAAAQPTRRVRATGDAATPRVPAAARQRAVEIADGLDQQHPGATTELHYTNPFELLVATILSAQCTDARVNQVTPALFRRYPDAHALAGARPDELEGQIQPTGFFRMKTRSLIGMSRGLVDRHGGEVPASMDALVRLPGVGRKTANVVLGHALGIPGFPVDRHVLRVTNRLGIARSDDAEVVEAVWCARLPADRWTRTSDALILHGRRVCRPTPFCDRCQVRSLCAYYASLGAKARRRAGPKRGGR
jgi:endonuclease-3